MQIIRYKNIKENRCKLIAKQFFSTSLSMQVSLFISLVSWYHSPMEGHETFSHLGLVSFNRLVVPQLKGSSWNILLLVACLIQSPCGTTSQRKPMEYSLICCLFISVASWYHTPLICAISRQLISANRQNTAYTFVIKKDFREDLFLRFFMFSRRQRK